MNRPPSRSALQQFLEDMKAKGVKVEIVSDAQAATKADVVICMKARKREPLILPDNVTAFCADCGSRIQLRPDVPKGPRRICYDCAAEEAKNHEGETTIYITAKTALELAMRTTTMH